MKSINWFYFDYFISSKKDFTYFDESIYFLLFSFLYPNKRKKYYKLFFSSEMKKNRKEIYYINSMKSLINEEINKALSIIGYIENEIVVYPFFGFYKQILAKYYDINGICNIFLFLENFISINFINKKDLNSIKNFIIHEYFHYIQYKPKMLDIIDLLIIEGSAVLYSKKSCGNSLKDALPLSEREYNQFKKNEKKMDKIIVKKILNHKNNLANKRGINLYFYYFSAKIVHNVMLLNNLDFNIFKDRNSYKNFRNKIYFYLKLMK